MRPRYSGDADFVYIRLDALRSDIEMFAPRGCDVYAVMDEVKQAAENNVAAEPGWIAGLIERHTPAPRLKRRYIPAKTRREVMERDAFACVHCGSTERLSIDHIRPFSRGGSHAPRNLQVLCVPCNSSKSARTPDEWAMLRKGRK